MQVILFFWSIFNTQYSLKAQVDGVDNENKKVKNRYYGIEIKRLFGNV